jgi:hypothetical protein
MGLAAAISIAAVFLSDENVNAEMMVPLLAEKVHVRE